MTWKIIETLNRNWDASKGQNTVSLWLQTKPSQMFIPARIRRMTGGYVFTGVCLFNFRGGGGYPIQLTWGIPHPADGGTPFLPDMWVQHPWPGWGKPHPRFRWGLPHRRSRQGVLCPRSRWGVPIPGPDGRYTRVSPPGQVPGQYGGCPPPGLDGSTPPVRRQSSIVSTCYATGAMSLAFTQEDFLVFGFFCY